MNNIVVTSFLSNDLEAQSKCPFCGSDSRSVVFECVKDWAFYCVDGEWRYWGCLSCGALYLDPRPNKSSIGKAYSLYYTHQQPKIKKMIDSIRVVVRNTVYKYQYGVNLVPFIVLPGFMRDFTQNLNFFVADPFLLRQLTILPKGKVLDIGCGNGDILKYAQDLGWIVKGIELDLEAVDAARNNSLDVCHGSYDSVYEFDTPFDLVICSHVIEHVHEPLRLLEAIDFILKPDGYLLLSVPNAKTLSLAAFGNNWRGLEAPRHLAIPSLKSMKIAFQRFGFQVLEVSTTGSVTAAESFRILRRGKALSLTDRIAGANFRRKNKDIKIEEGDFLNFLVKKTTAKSLIANTV